jgi:hypothetical protein
MRQESARERHDEEPLRRHCFRQWKPHTPQVLSVKALSVTAIGLEVVAECVHRSTKLKSLKDVEALARFVFDGLPPNLRVHVLRLETEMGELIFQRTILDLLQELTRETTTAGSITATSLGKSPSLPILSR